MWPLVVLGAVVLLFIGDWLIRLFPHPRLKHRYVLVTGCDSGFGEELVLKLNSERIYTVACCLTKPGMESLLSKVRVDNDSVVTACQMDVRDQHSVEAAYDFVTRTLHDKELWAVVNNAGVAGAAFFDDWLNVDDYRNAMEVNFFGAVRVTQTFKPLIKQSRGRFIFMTSVLGRVAMPMTGPYCTSKYALEGYCDMLRKELIPWGVGIHILEPGFFSTHLTDSALKEQDWRRRIKVVDKSILDEYDETFVTQGYEGQRSLLEALCSKDKESVTKAYMNAICSRFPRYRYFIGRQAKIFIFPLAYLPSIVSDVVAVVTFRLNFSRIRARTNGTWKNWTRRRG